MKFVIFAPPYTDKSMGVVVLHELCKELEACGYSAMMMLFTEPQPVLDDVIVIYPEVIDGNPLQAKNVVRYYLNREGYASGNKVNAGPKDFIITFDKLFNPDAQLLVRKDIMHPAFNDAGTKPWHERKLDCTYIGKGLFYSNECKVIPGTIEITRSAPKEMEATAELLRITRFLYTYDPLSALDGGAVLCGAVVVPLMFHPFKPEDITYPYVTIQDNVISIPDNLETGKQKLRKLIDESGAEFSKQVKEFARQTLAYFATA